MFFYVGQKRGCRFRPVGLTRSLLVLLFVFGFVNFPLYAVGSFDIHILNVGAANCVVCRNGVGTPSQVNLIVDAGYDLREHSLAVACSETEVPHYSREDIVTHLISLLGGFGSSFKTTIILSHLDGDHIRLVGSLVGLIQNVQLVVIGENSPGNIPDYISYWPNVCIVNNLLEVSVLKGSIGDWLRSIETALKCLRDGEQPVVEFLPSTRLFQTRDRNDSSLIVSVQYRGRNLVLTGDAPMSLLEATLDRKFQLGERHMDVVISPHHFSNTKLQHLLYQKYRPTLALGSTRPHSTYHFPKAWITDETNFLLSPIAFCIPHRLTYWTRGDAGRMSTWRTEVLSDVLFPMFTTFDLGCKDCVITILEGGIIQLRGNGKLVFQSLPFEFENTISPLFLQLVKDAAVSSKTLSQFLASGISAPIRLLALSRICQIIEHSSNPTVESALVRIVAANFAQQILSGFTESPFAESPEMVRTTLSLIVRCLPKLQSQGPEICSLIAAFIRGSDPLVLPVPSSFREPQIYADFLRLVAQGNPVGILSLFPDVLEHFSDSSRSALVSFAHQMFIRWMQTLSEQHIDYLDVFPRLAPFFILMSRKTSLSEYEEAYFQFLRSDSFTDTATWGRLLEIAALVCENCDSITIDPFRLITERFWSSFQHLLEGGTDLPPSIIQAVNSITKVGLQDPALFKFVLPLTSVLTTRMAQDDEFSLAKALIFAHGIQNGGEFPTPIHPLILALALDHIHQDNLELSCRLINQIVTSGGLTPFLVMRVIRKLSQNPAAYFTEFDKGWSDFFQSLLGTVGRFTDSVILPELLMPILHTGKLEYAWVENFATELLSLSEPEQRVVSCIRLLECLNGLEATYQAIAPFVISTLLEDPCLTEDLITEVIIPALEHTQVADGILNQITAVLISADRMPDPETALRISFLLIDNMSPIDIHKNILQRFLLGLKARFEAAFPRIIELLMSESLASQFSDILQAAIQV